MDEIELTRRVEEVEDFRDPQKVHPREWFWSETLDLFVDCLAANRRDLAQRIHAVLDVWVGEAETDHGLNSFEALAHELVYHRRRHD